MGKIFDLLEDPKDLVACACVCKSWATEIKASDRLFQDAWTREMSSRGLWRWSRAAGGYREQLRSNAVVRKGEIFALYSYSKVYSFKLFSNQQLLTAFFLFNILYAGDCIASVFPINRREGKINEVLLLDAKPEPRICTCHVRPVPLHCIRLTGWTVKVWSAATLSDSKNRPLCTIYDVVNHIQLEDGRLFVWRIKEGAIIRIRSSGVTGAAAQREEEECRHWAESPNIIASVLDPMTLELVDVPLDSTYGLGKCPFEFIDGGMPGGQVLVSTCANPTENEIKIRLFDLQNGQCFRESSITLPEVGPNVLPLHPDAAAMLLSRNSEAGGPIFAAAALYDCRVFRWKLKKEWMALETRYAADTTPVVSAPTSSSEARSAAVAPTQTVAAPPGEAEAGVPTDYDRIYNSRARIYDLPFGHQNCVKPDPEGQFSLHHIFTTLNNEPICDLSMSTSSKRIFIVGFDSLYILQDDGTLLFTIPMNQWRGVREARARFHSHDISAGAFSWPIPNSKATAMYIDITNSIYIANFEDVPYDNSPYEYKPDTRDLSDGQYTHRNCILSLVDDLYEEDEAMAGRTQMFVESHTDLLPTPNRPPYWNTGRWMVSPDAEPVILEYTQSGKTIFTSGNSKCSGTAALLKREKEEGSYLYGLGPKSVAGNRSGKNAGPFVSIPGQDDEKKATSGGGGGSGRQRKKKNPRSSEDSLAPRAIICTDTETGRRYKAIPIEGIIESIHAAGHLLVAAVAPENSYRDGVEGSLVVIDFSKEGFGLTEAQRAEQRQREREMNNEMNDALFGKKKNEINDGGGSGSEAVAVAARRKKDEGGDAGPSKHRRRSR
jgi:hypothetical protein